MPKSNPRTVIVSTDHVEQAIHEYLLNHNFMTISEELNGIHGAVPITIKIGKTVG